MKNIRRKNMKKNYIVKPMVMALITLLSLSGFAQPKSQEKPHHGGAAIAFLETVNEHEIAMAKDVKDKLKMPQVKEFAELMIKDHTSNLNAVREISKKTKIAAHETKKIKELKEHAKKDEEMIAKVSADKIDKEYIDAMVKGHKHALEHLVKVIPEVKNPMLKKFLEDTRAVVKSHLEKAEKLQQHVEAKAKSMPVMLKGRLPSHKQ
jgi:putative membrane protein